MMEPKRLLDASGLPSDMTRVLRAARNEMPPRGLRRNTWQSLVVRSAAAGIAVGAAGVVTTQGTALAAAASGAAVASAHAIVSKSVLLLALKSVAVGAGLGICTLATHLAISEHVRAGSSQAVPSSAASSGRAARLPSGIQLRAKSEQPSGAEPDVPREPLHEPAAPARAVVPEARSLTAVVRSPDASRANVRSPGDAMRSSALHVAHVESARFEARRVAEIRQMLRGGDGSGTLEALAQLDRQPSMNLLGQEREALRIDAHSMLGHRAEVARLVQRFRERYPNSPLSARWPTSEPH